MAIEAVLFDLDNTLTDWHLSQKLYCEDFVQRHFPMASPASRMNIVREIIQMGGDGNSVSLSEWASAVLAKWKLPLSQQELLDERNAAFPLFTRPMRGTLELLKALNSGYTLGIVTNGASKVQHKKIEVAGIGHYLDKIVCSSDIGYRKPDPRAFLACLNALVVQPQDAIFVGDSYDNDILGALDTGMRAVRVRVPGYPAPSHADVPEIDDLMELLPILDGMEER